MGERGMGGAVGGAVALPTRPRLLPTLPRGNVSLWLLSLPLLSPLLLLLLLLLLLAGGDGDGMDGEDRAWLEQRRALSRQMNKVQRAPHYPLTFC